MLIGRLQSLGHAHELLTEASWQGADLRDVVHGRDRRFLGAGAHLGPGRGAQPFRRADVRAHRARALHQRRQVRRAVERDRRGGGATGRSAAMAPTATWTSPGRSAAARRSKPASHEGFGLSLITAMGSNPTAEPVIEFAPEGFSCRIRVPLDTISPNRYDKASPVIASHAAMSRPAS